MLFKVGLFNICMNMVFNDHYYTKEDWKKIVWENVWTKEDEDVCILYKQPNRKKNWLFDIIEKPYYLTWWIISDNFPNLMCEKMSAMVCGCSLLKSHDLNLKKATF